MAEAPRKSLDRRDWIGAAIEIFVEEGVDGVRVLSLASRLGVSRGSFYWHFRNQRALLDAIIEHWRRNTEALEAASTEPVADFIERYALWTRCWLDQTRFDPKLDIAMRDWARRDAAVFALVQEADERRLAAIAAAFEQAGESAAMARIRANVMYYMQMGYYMISDQEPLALRLSRLSDYFLAFTGAPLDPGRAERMVAELIAAAEESTPASRR